MVQQYLLIALAADPSSPMSKVAHSPTPRNPPPFSSLLRHPYTYINKNKISLKKGKRAERWLKQLRACTVLAEDPREVSST